MLRLFAAICLHIAPTSTLTGAYVLAASDDSTLTHQMGLRAKEAPPAPHPHLAHYNRLH